MSQSRPDNTSSMLARNFVGRQAVIERLTGLCRSIVKDGAPWGACVIGEPGSGKSALFGEIVRRMKDSDALVLAHVAGPGPGASSVDAMLRRWINELGSALGVGEVDLSENADPKILDMTFASLLRRTASQRRVVVLIDALDQFKKTSRARLAACLPRPWPINARLVATAIAGGASKALAERPGVETLSLPPLDAAEARGIIESIGGASPPKLEPAVLDALLAKKHAGEPAWGNPLWLVLALEELALIEADTGTPPERLRQSMLDRVEAMPTDPVRFHRATFDRAAEQVGATTVPALLGLIVASRAGWREGDLQQLLPRVSGEPWDQQRFAALRRLLHGHIGQRGELGQWDFNHVQMRAAARSRLAALRVSEPQLHLLIADHLLSLSPDDQLRATETMVHLLASSDDGRAARYYGDASLNDAEVDGATRVLSDAVTAPPAGTPASVARDLCRLLETADDTVGARLAERFLFNLDDALEHHAPVDARLMILNSVEQAFERLLRTDPGNAGWQRARAVAQDRIGDTLLAQGSLPEALKSFRNGLAIRERLARAEPGNAAGQRDLSISYGKLGDAQVMQRNLPAALISFRDQFAIVQRMAEAAPDDAGWQRDLSTAYEKIGDVLMVQGDLPEALKSYRDELALAKRLAKSDSDNAEWQRDLSVSHDRVGDVLVAQENLPEALESFLDGLAIRERLAKRDPDNLAWQRGLSVSYARIGDVFVTQGDLTEAVKSFGDEVLATERLARADFENADWQRDLSVAHDRIGDVLVAQSKLPEALKAFRDALTIREQLAHADPDNIDWQRGLAVSHDRVGDVLMSQGDLIAALKSFRDQLAIVEKLARSDPGNTGWQRDLSVSYEKLGDVLEDQGNLADALKSFREGLAIRERLARSDPSNVGWQRGLSVSYDCIGDVLVAQGNLSEALKSFRDGLAIRERLARSDTGNPGWQRDLTVSYDRIGDVLEAQGNLPEALKSFREGVSIAERVARSHPDNADWQRGLAVSNAHLAEVYRRSEDRESALAALRQGQSVMKKVVKLSPDNAGWKKDLGWFNEQIASLTK